MSEEAEREDVVDAAGEPPQKDQTVAEGEGPVPSADGEAEREPEQPPFDLSEDARAPARQVREVLQAWAGRVAATGGAGRGATTAARMATARALAELRRVQLPELADIAPVRDYLHRATSAVTQAARDIERNRYSLHEMHHQLERLAGLEKRILPGEDAQEGAEAEPREPEQPSQEPAER